jgi:hypothetical protein
MPTKIAILHGPGASAAARNILLASGDDYEPVFLVAAVATQDPDADPLVALLSRMASVVTVKGQGWVDAARSAGVAAATTFNDQYVAELDTVTRALRLPGCPTRPGCWDKLRQREVLNSAGASQVLARAVSCLDTFTAAREAIGRAGILKPRRSSTGRGVRLVAANEPSLTVWDEMAARYGPERMSGYLYEQLMDDGGGDGWLAPFVSVDTVSFANQRLHFGLFDKLPLVRGFIETGHLAPTAIPTQQQVEILSLAGRALAALGISDRVTHTEIRLTSTGPQVIEVNGRLGGYLYDLSRTLTGANPVRYALDVAAGQRPDVPALPGGQAGRRFAATLKLPLDSGSPALAWRAARRLRTHPLVVSVEAPPPIDTARSCACALVTAMDRGSLLTSLTDVIRTSCEDAAVRDALDPEWLRVVTAPPTRLTVS